MRASNLQELVYKNGQAGITKATVTLTFDNSDKKGSPLGYENYNEISITRQVRTRKAFVLFVYNTVFLGGYWGQEQVPDQRHQHPGEPRAGPLPLRPAERQQPALPHHAGPDHQGAQHEAARDLGHDRGGRRHHDVRVQEAAGAEDHREEGL